MRYKLEKIDQVVNGTVQGNTVQFDLSGNQNGTASFTNKKKRRWLTDRYRIGAEYGYYYKSKKQFGSTAHVEKFYELNYLRKYIKFINLKFENKC